MFQDTREVHRAVECGGCSEHVGLGKNRKRFMNDAASAVETDERSGSPRGGTQAAVSDYGTMKNRLGESLFFKSCV